MYAHPRTSEHAEERHRSTLSRGVRSLRSDRSLLAQLLHLRLLVRRVCGCVSRQYGRERGAGALARHDVRARNGARRAKRAAQHHLERASSCWSAWAGGQLAVMSVVVGVGVEPSHWHGRRRAHPMVLKTARLDPGDAAMLNEPPQLRLSRLRREATRVGRQPEWGGSQSGEATRVGRQPEWQPERRIRDNQGRPVEIAPPRRAAGPPTLPLVVEGSGIGLRDIAPRRASQPRRRSVQARRRTPSPECQASYRASREDPTARAHHGALAHVCPQRRVRRAAMSSAAAAASDGLVRWRYLPPRRGR